ncbi:5-deoxy-glucuronate isomerase [Curtobacterium sp. 'Ferrero']|uniref:5-deoxy-glucuronate isomerase n=1 Tax=Curtobacterium sp. 'Ferrero' TaxID=2033654 RepID=UPI000BDCCB58|nr:5-deoxy-glucuronate isomerase [Curtobacterium sp. 'Ferrero']PCN49491.1 5-deoxy-glucuronate isomerase [Curtobacterium sp. 'Ferrero']
MTNDDWFIPAGSRPEAGWTDVVDGRIPGWAHTGLRTGTLRDGGALRLPADAVERIIVPLAGSCTVAYDDTVQVLDGRASVFAGPTDVLYLGSGTAATITGAGRVAVAEAPTEVVRPSAYIARDDVPVELRGAGRSSRQVHNFGTPAVLDAERLIVCEVITPAGNWSSYPPHKHDTTVPGEESDLEEIYYYESAVARGCSAPSQAAPFGLHRTYASDDRPIDEFRQVRSGDVALVPYGWHGPAVAAPGYDLYYLNVMAGPGPERVWDITDDPAHGWVRTTWESEPIDPRLPYTPQKEDV